MAYSTYPGAASGQSAGGQYAGFDGGATWSDGVSTNVYFTPMTSGTGSSQIPVGTTAQRDATPILGSLRYNTTTSTFEGYNGSSWVAAINTSVVLKTSSTGSAQIPAGTTAQRDVAPATGSLRWNTTTSLVEVYTGSTWVGPNGGSSFLSEHDIEVSTSYTITTGRNAVSAGPLTILTGATVTVPAGSTWSIV